MRHVTRYMWHVTHDIWPLGRFGYRVAKSVCLFVCLRHRKTPTSWGQKNFWSKGASLVFASNDTIFVCFSSRRVFQLFLVFGTALLCNRLLWASLLWIMGELATPPAPTHPPWNIFDPQEREKNWTPLKNFIWGPKRGLEPQKKLKTDGRTDKRMDIATTRPQLVKMLDPPPKKRRRTNLCLYIWTLLKK